MGMQRKSIKEMDGLCEGWGIAPGDGRLMPEQKRLDKIQILSTLNNCNKVKGNKDSDLIHLIKMISQSTTNNLIMFNNSCTDSNVDLFIYRDASIVVSGGTE